ncbi:MAG: hypothetical protein H6860_00475 [Rhodospirillales bacterium]|nr:hypothetical protein [Rhodospirillales bacterium]
MPKKVKDKEPEALTPGEQAKLDAEKKKEACAEKDSKAEVVKADEPANEERRKKSQEASFA